MTERFSASFHNMPAARLPLAAPVEEVVGGGGAGMAGRVFELAGPDTKALK